MKVIQKIYLKQLIEKQVNNWGWDKAGRDRIMSFCREDEFLKGCARSYRNNYSYAKKMARLDMGLMF